MAASNSVQIPDVQTLMNYTDAEIAAFIQSSTRRGINEAEFFSTIEVADPENLTEEILQRLRNHANSLSDHVLDAVNSRLLELTNSADRDFDNPISPPRASTSPRSSLPPSPPENVEKRFYYQLQSEGGQPLYPIEQVAQIQKNPDAYRQMLQPWTQARHGQPEWHVFQAQYVDWDSFKRWQIDSRRQGRSLAEHERVIQQSLSHYEVQTSFKLLIELRRQDKVTTWVEYLAYTYNINRRLMSRSQYEARVKWILLELTKRSDETGDNELDEPGSRGQGAGTGNNSPVNEITTDQSIDARNTRSKRGNHPRGKRARDDATEEQQPRKRRAGGKSTLTTDRKTTDQLSGRPITRSKTTKLPQGKRGKDDRPGAQRRRRKPAGDTVKE
ncbi:hypothetical protein QBC42DRAFT_349419, partial [Cladorrhinum samala]